MKSLIKFPVGSWRQKAEFFNDGAWSVFDRVSGVPLPAVAGVDSKLPLSTPQCANAL